MKAGSGTGLKRGVVALAIAALALCMTAATKPGETPRLVIQGGSLFDPDCMAFSPDGTRVAFGSGQKMIGVVDMTTKKLYASWLAHVGAVTAVAFSNDGSKILSGSTDMTVKLWDAATGSPVRRFEKHQGDITCLVPLPDGKRFVSGSRDGTLVVWNYGKDKPERTLSGHAGAVLCAVVSPDGATLLSGSSDKTARLWRLSDGKELRRFEGHAGDIRAAAFAPDGTAVYTASADSTVRSWDVSGAAAPRTIRPHRGPLVSIALSKDGATAYSCGADNTFRIWDAETGAERRSANLNVIGAFATAYSISASTLMVEFMDDGLIKTFSLDTAEETGAVRGMSDEARSVACSPDGSLFMSGTNGAAGKLWNATGIRLERAFAGDGSSVSSVAFLPDGRRALTGSSKGSIKLWDLRSGALLKELAGHQGSVSALAVSRDGKLAVSGSGSSVAVSKPSAGPGGVPSMSGLSAALVPENAVGFWDLASDAPPRFAKVHAGKVNDVAISPDGKLAVSASDDKTLVVWDVAAGKPLRTLAGHGYFVTSASFSPDGKRIVSTGFDDTIRAWDAASGKQLRTIETGAYLLHDAAFAPDGRSVLVAAVSDEIALWDIEKGKKTRVFRADTPLVNSVAFSSDGTRFFASAADGVLSVWDFAKGERLCSFASSKDGAAWLAWTDDGYWDGSADCGSLVAMARGSESWNIDQFAVRNNRPDILLERLGSKDAALVAHYREQYARRSRRLGLSEAGDVTDYRVPKAELVRSRVDGTAVEIELRLSSDGADLSRYQVYANDVPVFGAYGKPVAGKKASVVERIELVAGQNKLEVSCMDARGAESFRVPAYFRRSGTDKPNLYFIGFGVSRYRDRNLDLGWAAQDILDLEARFKSMAGAGFGAVTTRTYIDANATRASLAEAKGILAGAKPEDVFVLAISGHGLHDNDAESTYYYLTHETDLGDLKGTAANFDLVEELLQGIAPRNKLFLMDTCESGEADEASIAAAQTGGKGVSARSVKTPDPAPGGGGKGVGLQSRSVKEALRTKDRYVYNDLARRSGSIVFSSCKGGELSYEFDELRNGAFTEAVLSALSSKVADANGDGRVDTKELRTYVERRVPELTRNAQHPTVDRDNLSALFSFPLR